MQTVLDDSDSGCIGLFLCVNQWSSGSLPLVAFLLHVPEQVAVLAAGPRFVTVAVGGAVVGIELLLRLEHGLSFVGQGCADGF